MKKLFKHLILCYGIILNVSIYAQSPFKLSVLGGINKSQIDGDYQSGYDKTGWSVGLQGGIILNRKWEINTQLLYNPKGTQPSRSADPGAKKAEIQLSYAEIPLLGVYRFKKSEMGFYRWSITGGISYGRLLKSAFNITKFSLIDTLSTIQLSPDNLNRTEWSIIVGFNYHIQPNWGISLTHSTAINLLYEDKSPIDLKKPPKADHYSILRNYFFSLKLFYDFIAPPPLKSKKLKNKA